MRVPSRNWWEDPRWYIRVAWYVGYTLGVAIGVSPVAAVIVYLLYVK